MNKKTTTKPEGIVLSLRETYADLVFAGHKQVELRRGPAPHIVTGMEVYVYVPEPRGEIRGGFTIARIERGLPLRLWKTLGDRSGLTQAAFEAYYKGTIAAWALEMDRVWTFHPSTRLDKLVPDPTQARRPARSWRYATGEETEALGKIERRAVQKWERPQTEHRRKSS